jgi:hypothetical protein
MINGINRRRFLLSLAFFIALLPGCSSFAPKQTIVTQEVYVPKSFSFAVLSDPQWVSDGWVNALTEVMDSKVNPDPKFDRSEFIFVPGDTPPIDVMYEEFTRIFNGASITPLFLPVIGNHDADDNGGFPGGMAGMGNGAGMGPQGQGSGQPGMGMPQGAGGPSGQAGQPGMDMPPEGAGQQPGGGMGMGQQGGMGPGDNMGGTAQSTGDPSIIDMEFISDKIIEAIPGAVRMSDKSCSYYYDYRNVRVISLDAFSGEAGTGGVITDKGRAWTEKAITSAPATIDHIFIGFHAPAFPRGRHTSDCFVTNAGQRNAFWNMLIAHKDRVRAVFNGHTHVYCRVRVLDPAGADANDFSKYPVEEGGIYQVNAGSTSMGMKNTFLRVEVEGKNLYFRTYEAENGKDQPFAVKEEWSIIANN